MDLWNQKSVCDAVTRSKRLCRRSKKQTGESPRHSIQINYSVVGLEVPKLLSGVVWYTLVMPQSGFLQVDTFTSPWNQDTEIAVYDDGGLLVATNDDSNSTLRSQIKLTDLVSGRYFVAVGYYNTEFHPVDFLVTSPPPPLDGVIRLTVTFPTERVAIPTLFSTGVGLSVGDVDVHYDVVTSVVPGTIGPATATSAPGWAGNTQDSAWIGWGGVDVGSGIGSNEVRTTFDLSGFDPKTAYLLLNIMVDDELTMVLLNGQQQKLTTGYNFGTWHTPVLVLNGFLPNINTLTFRWANVGGPSGIRVLASGGASVKVP